MKRNRKLFILCLVIVSFSIFCTQAQVQPATATKSTVGEDVRDFWNLGIGFDAKGGNYTSYALDMKKIQTVSDTQANGNKLHYMIIENKYSLSDSSFLGIDLGLEVSVPYVELKSSTSIDLYNSIQTSQHSVSMVISFVNIKGSLDVINAEFSESARSYYLQNGKEAFIAKYGDRYLDKIDIGGRLDFIYRLSVSDTSRINKFKLKVACEIKVAEVFKGEVNVYNDKLTKEEMAQIVTEVDVFYNGLPWRAEVKDYNDYCSLRDNFLEWLKTNSVAVNKKYVKYDELAFTDNIYYAILNEWYRLREIVNAANRKAQSENNWDMETKCNDAAFEINTVISAMKPDVIPKPPTFSAYKEILDYACDDQNQLDKSKAIPVGTVISYIGDALNIPIGWMFCDGSAIDKAEYNDLYTVIGDTYTTSGTKAEQFNLPDLRGQFLRGLDTTGKIDPEGVSRKLGSYQADEFKAHNHTYQEVTSQKAWSGSSDTVGDDRTSKRNTSTAGGSETRPKNVAVNFMIKY